MNTVLIPIFNTTFLFLSIICNTHFLRLLLLCSNEMINIDKFAIAPLRLCVWAWMWLGHCCQGILIYWCQLSGWYFPSPNVFWKASDHRWLFVAWPPVWQVNNHCSHSQIGIGPQEIWKYVPFNDNQIGVATAAAAGNALDQQCHRQRKQSARYIRLATSNSIVMRNCIIAHSHRWFGLRNTAPFHRRLTLANLFKSMHDCAGWLAFAEQRIIHDSSVFIPQPLSFQSHINTQNFINLQCLNWI